MSHSKADFEQFVHNLRLNLNKAEFFATDINEKGSGVHPPMFYGLECWPTSKDNELRLAAKETKIFRSTNGET